MRKCFVKNIFSALLMAICIFSAPGNLARAESDVLTYIQDKEIEFCEYFLLTEEVHDCRVTFNIDEIWIDITYNKFEGFDLYTKSLSVYSPEISDVFVARNNLAIDCYDHCIDKRYYYLARDGIRYFERETSDYWSIEGPSIKNLYKLKEILEWYMEVIKH